MKKVLARNAFTLIELLIVVAIIAILAAIAVPNFLEAQVRAKVSRVKSDIRTVATAVESYRVDNNRYPPTPFVGPGADVLRVVPTRLSTPVAYVSSANFLDPFIGPNIGDFETIDGDADDDGRPDIRVYSFDASVGDPEGADPIAGKRFYYQSYDDARRSFFGTATGDELLDEIGAWEMASLGPNQFRDLDFDVNPIGVLLPYDPTNGTISPGDIIRTQKDSEGVLNPGD